jgi:hypothetical protein
MGREASRTPGRCDATACDLEALALGRRVPVNGYGSASG